MLLECWRRGDDGSELVADSLRAEEFANGEMRKDILEELVGVDDQVDSFVCRPRASDFRRDEEVLVGMRGGDADFVNWCNAVELLLSRMLQRFVERLERGPAREPDSRVNGARDGRRALCTVTLAADGHVG